PNRSPIHSTPLVNSWAPSRITSSANTRSNQSNRTLPRRGPEEGTPCYAPPTIAPVDVEGFLRGLQGFDAPDQDEPSLRHVERLPARDPSPEPLPAGLPDLVRDRLDLLGIHGLYPHQREALDLLDAGRNVILATGTASGKTLVYNLAFARAAVERAKTTALYVFPTKA